MSKIFKTLSTGDLIVAILKKAKLRHKAYAHRMMSILVEILKTELKAGNKVQIKGFGTFFVDESKPKKLLNFKTGEYTITTPRKRIRFIMSRKLKETLNDIE